MCDAIEDQVDDRLLSALLRDNAAVQQQYGAHRADEGRHRTVDAVGDRDPQQEHWRGDGKTELTLGLEAVNGVVVLRGGNEQPQMDLTPLLLDGALVLDDVVQLPETSAVPDLPQDLGEAAARIQDPPIVAHGRTLVLLLFRAVVELLSSDTPGYRRSTSCLSQSFSGSNQPPAWRKRTTLSESVVITAPTM
jgi:hypothetical protein